VAEGGEPCADTGSEIVREHDLLGCAMHQVVVSGEEHARLVQRSPAPGNPLPRLVSKPCIEAHGVGHLPGTQSRLKVAQTIGVEPGKHRPEVLRQHLPRQHRNEDVAGPTPDTAEALDDA
jgi:hypothetical protein